MPGSRGSPGIASLAFEASSFFAPFSISMTIRIFPKTFFDVLVRSQPERNVSETHPSVIVMTAFADRKIAEMAITHGFAGAAKDRLGVLVEEMLRSAAR